MVSYVLLIVFIFELVNTCQAKAIKLDFSVNQLDQHGKLRGIHKRAQIATNISNLNYIYTATMYVGSDKQNVTVQVDTGSGDTWVIGAQSCVNCAGGFFNPQSSTSFQEVNEDFGIQYADGTGAEGIYGIDNVQLESGPSIPFQFGVATTDSIGWGVLALGQVSVESTRNKYPNYISALKQSGQISKAAYSVYLDDASATTGSVIFGGYDEQKFFGKLVKLPITSHQVSVKLDGITLSQVEYLSRGESVVLDTGTSYTSLPAYLVNNIAREMGAKIYGNNLVASCNQPANKYVTFNFDNVKINVPYSGLVSSLYDKSGQKLDTCSLDISVGNILGDNFLRHAYVVYDYDAQQISLAQVRYTTSSNILEIV